MNKSTSKKSKNNLSNSSQIIKSSLTWLLVFAACFAIGWFPLAKVYYDRTVSKVPQKSSSNSGTSSQHVASSVVTPMPPIKRGPQDSDVIKIEESKDDPSVQQAESPDGVPHKTKGRRHTTQSDTPINLDDTATVSPSEKTDTSTKDTDPKSGTTTDVKSDSKTPDSVTDYSDKPAKRVRRRSRTNDTHSNSDTKDVQKGEAIDR